MKSLILSAAAGLILAGAPAWADTVHHTTVHRTVHKTAHTDHHVTHVNRKVNVHRTVRTTHAKAWHHTGAVHHTTTWHGRTWHGRTWHGTTHSAGLHMHVNIGALHANINAPHRYHYGTYRRPTGWYAHRWTYGEHLPHAWYGSDYRISNYITFGLVAPPDGYEWVRVGSDALLIDIDTGEVVRVEYGVFY